MDSVQILSQIQSKIGSANWSDWGIYRWQWYDYVRYPGAGTQELLFFVNPLGSTDPTSALQKTLEQTNSPKARSFGQTFYIITQIRTHVHLLPKKRQVSALANDADLLYTTIGAMGNAFVDLLGAGVLQIQIGQKDYFEEEKPFRRCPPGFGPKIYNHACLSTTCNWHQQSRNQDDVFAITPAQMIEPEQTLTAGIVFPEGIPAVFTDLVNSATPAIDIGLIFDGYIVRPAQ